MAFRIINFTDFQEWSKTSGGDVDGDLANLFNTIIIPGVTAQFSRFLRRDFDKTERFETFDGDGSGRLFVNSYPIDTGQTIELYYDTATPRAYDSTTLLTQGEDYFVLPNRGLFRSAGTRWHGSLVLKAKWTGGFLTGDGTGTPDWMVMPAMIQCLHVFQSIGQAGWTSRSLEGGSIAFPPRAWLLKEVKDMLAPERLVKAA